MVLVGMLIYCNYNTLDCRKASLQIEKHLWYGRDCEIRMKKKGRKLGERE
jgi:hypothetical protein